MLRTVADSVRELLSTTPVSGLMIVGGDTAQTVFRALHASGLVLAGELTPGVPYGRLLHGPFAGLPTATKAGGFGADTVLKECLTFLQQWVRSVSKPAPARVRHRLPRLFHLPCQDLRENEHVVAGIDHVPNATVEIGESLAQDRRPGDNAIDLLTPTNGFSSSEKPRSNRGIQWRLTTTQDMHAEAAPRLQQFE